MTILIRFSTLFFSTLLLVARGSSDAPVATGEETSQTEPVPEESADIEPAPEAAPPPPGLAPLIAPWKGDLDGMVERRLVRVLAVQSPVLYFVDRGRELGLTYESAKAFETYLNGKLGTGNVKVHVLLMPVARDELIPRLLAGQGDIAAATLTITPERLQQVDFSDPAATGVSEILVTGPGTPVVESVEDLSGMEVHVRASSSYAEHLKALNERFAAEGKAPVEIVPADELLEDGDILEMIAAGLIPATVADSFMVDLWAQVFPQLKSHPSVAVATGGEIAMAFRKESPKLAQALNDFVKRQKQGTLAGNVLINKYLKSAKWVKNARGEEEIARFRSMVGLNATRVSTGDKPR